MATMRPGRYADVRQQISDWLLAYCKAQTEQAGAVHPSYARLWHSLTDQVEAGGKRLRPYVCLLAHESYGGRSGGRLQLAAAWELLHISLLIHDDIIDRDDYRHNQPNLSGRYQNHYAAITDPAVRKHAALSAALLAGDVALSAAYDLIAGSRIAAAAKPAMIRRLHAAVFAVGGGELLDAEAGVLPASAADPYLIAAYKTASYSFVGPLLAGAELARAGAAQLAALTDYGQALGIGFQLADDVLGVFGASAVTGKSTSSDLSEGKRTALLLASLNSMTPAARRSADRILSAAAPYTVEQVEQLRRLIAASDGRAIIEQRIGQYHQAAHDAIERLDVPAVYRQAFAELADRVLPHGV